MAGRRPGCVKTGGRVKGTLNRTTLEKISGLLDAERELGAKLSDAEAKGLKPLDVMLMVMRMALKAGNSQLAVACAEKSAPYMHPRLASTVIDTTIRKPLAAMSDTELAEFVAETQAARDAAKEDPPTGSKH